MIRIQCLIIYLVISFNISVVASANEIQRKINVASLFMAEMPWEHVVYYTRNGYDTVIVPSGGIEQNGLHMVLGKHDYIVKWASYEIAKQLGNALIAPVISFVPQGKFYPPEGNMRYPGTIGITDAAYRSLLDGISRSLKNAGFKNICFLADHGGSLESQQFVADYLNLEWRNEKVRVINVFKYYEAGQDQIQYLKDKGFSSADIGDHAGMLDTSELMYINPNGVDISSLLTSEVSPALRGDSGDPTKSNAALGSVLMQIKVMKAISQIRQESIN